MVRINADKFLYYWVLGTVFIVPLLIFNYGFSASVIRQLVLFVLAAIGWLIWAGRAILGKQKIAWKRTVFGYIALALLAVVLLSSLLANDLSAVWGWRGGLSENNPWGWLGVLGLGLLITQVMGTPVIPSGAKRSRGIPAVNDETPRQARGDGYYSELLLTSYLLSSTLLALFVLVWWGANQELVMPALTSFAATSLLFTVNAIIITALSLPLRGRIKIFWLAILLVHLLAIFAYDYDAAWYLLGGGILVLSLLQLIWEKKLDKVDFIIPFALIGLSLVLLFAPVQAISKKLGFDFSTLNSVDANVAYPRFFQHASWREKIMGAGLGQGAEYFWEKAELVDMRQARQFPPLGNGFSAMLWDGGIFFSLAWLGILIWLGVKVWRFAKTANGDNLSAILTLLVGSLGYVAALALLPFDWFIFFSFMILAAFLAGQLSGRKDLTIDLSQGQRSFLGLGATLALALAGLLIFFGGMQIKSRLDFFRSIKVGNAKAGTAVDLKLLDTAIKRVSGVYGYRLARVDLMVQALQEKDAKDIKPLLTALAGDYDYLSVRRLSGANWWQLAARAETIARVLEKEPAAAWYKRAGELYEKAIETLPRNVMGLVDAARFYRQNGDEKFYPRAQELIDKALSIDDTYEPAYGEKASLLALLGKSDEAYDIMKKIADNSPAAAYSAARLAFAAKKYDEAVNYYRKTIAQNPNHLQARYELIQALMALGDKASAKKELDTLETLVPKEDAQTQTLLKGLRELLK